MADQRREDAEVGLEACGERAASLLVEKVSQFRLQLQMQLQGAVEEARAGTARAVLFDRLQTGFQHLRAGGQPQVVVGAEHDAALALHDDLRALPRFQRVEIGV